jgi:actin-related protein
LFTLQQAHAIFIPGSDDPKYTASKLYPYLLTQKSLLAIFNHESSAIPILKEYGVKHVYNYNEVSNDDIIGFLQNLLAETPPLQQYHKAAIQKYSAENMTLQQCQFFNTVLNASH